MWHFYCSIINWNSFPCPCGTIHWQKYKFIWPGSLSPLGKWSKIDCAKIKTKQKRKQKRETYEQKLRDLLMNLSGVDWLCIVLIWFVQHFTKKCCTFTLLLLYENDKRRIRSVEWRSHHKEPTLLFVNSKWKLNNRENLTSFVLFLNLLWCQVKWKRKTMFESTL